jgi:hypothetical protein
LKKDEKYFLVESSRKTIDYLFKVNRSEKKRAEYILKYISAVSVDFTKPLCYITKEV